MPSKLLGGNPEEVELTKEESDAIESLESVAKQWPKSLWLLSVGGSLWVMRQAEDGQRAVFPHDGDGQGGEVDLDYCVCQIFGIENDGGDW